MRSSVVFRDRLAFLGVALGEGGGGRRAQPDFIVQKTIDDDSRGGADGMDGRNRGVRLTRLCG